MGQGIGGLFGNYGGDGTFKTSGQKELGLVVDGTVDQVLGAVELHADIAAGKPQIFDREDAVFKGVGACPFVKGDIAEFFRFKQRCQLILHRMSLHTRFGHPKAAIHG